MESIGMIRHAYWSQDPPYDIEGEFWTVRLGSTRSSPSSASAICRSPTKSGPPISMSVASRNSPTARVAAGARLRHHLGPITCRDQALASHWQIYSEACSRGGPAGARRQLAG